MAEMATKYVSRASRYTLTPEDNKLLYFAQKGQVGEKQQTELINISASGIAFLVERDIAPDFGHLIKFEFTAPGEGKIAWWGRVVRIEDYSRNSWWRNDIDYSSEDLVVVAIKFEDLPQGHRKTIRQGIDRRLFQIKRAQTLKDISLIYDYVRINFRPILIYTGLILLTLLTLYTLTLPTDNYNQDRGAPWGQRFSK